MDAESRHAGKWAFVGRLLAARLIFLRVAGSFSARVNGVIVAGWRWPHCSPVIVKPPTPSPTARLFKNAPPAAQALRKQATRELRLKARAAWWQQNRPKP
jgi:hypothetical protein